MMTTEARNAVTQADTERSSVVEAYPRARSAAGLPAAAPGRRRGQALTRCAITR